MEDLDKIFDVEDRIANDVIAALSEGPRAPAGNEIRGSTRKIAAYRPFLRGWQYLKAKPVPNFEDAIPYLEKAVLNDPNYGNAHAALAAAYVAKSRYIFPGKFDGESVAFNEGELSDMWIARQEFLDKARTYLNSALKEPTAYAYRISAQIHYIKNNYEAAARDARSAHITDTNDADSAADYGMSLIWNGETEEGIKQIEKAISINPKGKETYNAYIGIAKFVQRKYRASIADLKNSLGVAIRNETPIVHMIAAYGHLGDIQNAQRFIDRLNKGHL